MASNQEIIDWFLSHKKELKLKVGKGAWIKNWAQNFFDFSASVEINGKTYFGRGIDLDMDLAFVKACVESLERAICEEYGVYSSGVAGHSDLEDAKKNAYAELVERDVFLCHYLTKTSFMPINPDGSTFIDYSDVINRLASKNVTLKLFELHSTENLNTVLCVSTLPNSGVVVGLSSSRDLGTAIEKSFFESLSNTIAYLDGNTYTPLLKEELEHTDIFRSIHHFRFNLTDNSYSRLKGLTNGKEVSHLENPSVIYKELKSSSQIINDSPLVFVKAESDKLQNIFYGETVKEKLNFERLNLFASKEIHFEDIEKRMHPLG